MKIRPLSFQLVAAGVISLAAWPTIAQEKDITEAKGLVGPGSVSIVTKGDIMMSFGAQFRQIPTTETNYDFGISDSTPGLTFFQTHVNEAGFVNRSYIRSEDRLYFATLPKDQSWSFYAALEFDGLLDTRAVDARGGNNRANSDFGLERLLGTIALPGNNRLYAGWDVYTIDVLNDGAGLVYADDNPGVWINGQAGGIGYSFGYWKLRENNFQSTSAAIKPAADDDRDVLAGYVDIPVGPGKVRGIYAFDRINQVAVATIAEAAPALGGGPAGLSSGFAGGTADVQSHHIGAAYTSKFGIVEVMGEGVYQFGTATRNGGPPTAIRDFDIEAYALSGDVRLDLKSAGGAGFKPHIGFIYTSGDKSATDDKLQGYNAVNAGQRFAGAFGGEHSIIGDTNYILGTNLYSYFPEALGNGTPIVTGGLENLAGAGFGRGDNPGLSLITLGVTITPFQGLILKSDVSGIKWNKAQVVTSFVVPGPVPVNTTVGSGYVGTEWKNEATLAFNKYVFLKGQLAFLFPGDGIKDITSARTATAAGPGPRSDEVASRVAVEFIINF